MNRVLVSIHQRSFVPGEPRLASTRLFMSAEQQPPVKYPKSSFRRRLQSELFAAAYDKLLY